MNAVVQSIPLNQLHHSALNVRKTGGANIENLAASIRARGLIHNLTVFARPREAKRGGFDVVVGKRRLTALRLLAKRRELPADTPIDCRVVSREDATSTSLAENVHREAMHPADQFAAFAKLVDEGKPAEDIAAEFGVSPDTVQKRLRLAKVSAQVLALYRADEFTLEQVMAFTLTDDHAAQDALLEGGARPSAWQIRRSLTETAVRGDDPRARLVGRDAYVAAGGSIRRDLFGEDATEYFEDAALLERLASDKMEKAAAKLRKRLPWVETVVGTLDYETRSQFGRIPTVRQEPDAKTAKQLQRLHTKLAEAQQQVAALDEQGGDDDAADRAWQKANERCEAIEEKIAGIERELLAPDPQAAALAGAVVALGHGGRIEILDGLIRPEDRAKVRRPKAKADAGRDAEDAGVFNDPRPLRQDLSVYLTVVAQQALANDVPLALRALAFQLVLALRGERGDGHGIDAAATDHANPGPSQTLAGSPADEARIQWHAAWERTLPADAEALWTWCQKASDHMVVSLLAYCAARSFTAVQRYDDGQPAMPLLAALGLNMVEHWRSNADYFKRLRKADTLAILAKHGHGGKAFAKLKRDVLAESAAATLAKSGWLPPTLSTVSG